MNHRKKSDLKNTRSINRPFENLNYLIDRQSLNPNPITPARARTHPNQTPEIEKEKSVFLTEMNDVIPIKRDNYHITEKPLKSVETFKADSDFETIKHLKDLLNTGKGYVVSNTPEYMEGIGYRVNPRILKLLHNGHFTIQSYLDLHRFTVKDAKKVFNRFLKSAISEDKRSLLIVHGRGLSSPGKPVLKLSVYKWLTTGLWKKWILAFASARLCDGGAGATYVLLRKKPLSRKERIGHIL